MIGTMIIFAILGLFNMMSAFRAGELYIGVCTIIILGFVSLMSCLIDIKKDIVKAIKGGVDHGR